MSDQGTPTYAILYRTGGTANFTWHRLNRHVYEDAIATLDSIRRGGRLAWLEFGFRTDEWGMPTTYAGVDS